MQCHPSTGFCWCVDANGRELEASRGRDPSMSKESCAARESASSNTATVCDSQREKALARTKTGMMGVFVPACASDGTFAAKQCHASTGQCWCSDQAGKEMHGTRGRPGPTDEDRCVVLRSQCSASLDDTCRLPPTSEGACELSMTRYFFNARVGKCETVSVEGCKGNNNSFSSMEECSKTCPSDDGDGTSFSCESRLAVAAQLENKGLLGVFTPSCAEDGSWKAMQCHDTLGCWCADYYGVAYSGTQTGTGDPEKLSACEDLRRSCTPCARSADERCSEKNQARGENCILGSCIESDGKASDERSLAV
jgi:hypothetical protein